MIGKENIYKKYIKNITIYKKGTYINIVFKGSELTTFPKKLYSERHKTHISSNVHSNDIKMKESRAIAAETMCWCITIDTECAGSCLFCPIPEMLHTVLCNISD